MITQAAEKFSPIQERWRIVNSIPVNPKNVIAITSEYFNLRKRDVMSERQFGHLCLCRAIIYKILYRRTGLTQEEIGEMFGRDRTSIIHGIRTVTGWMDVYPEIKYHFETLEAKILSE